MDTQAVLDVALTSTAATLGLPEATTHFRQALASDIKIDVSLTTGQRSQLQKMIMFPLVFVGGKSVTNDHPLLVALRDIVRISYEREFGIANTAERTLVVGASVREISMYQNNSHIHYYGYGKENKDYDRAVRPALQRINRGLKSKDSKKDFRVFKSPNEPVTMRPAIKRYNNFQSIIAYYMNLHKLPATIHLNYIETNTLVLEDSFYNFTPEMWVNMFDTTGANVAYGYGLLPLELLWPEMPENPVYSVTKQGKRTALVFRHGYCNGYIHDTAAWITLLRSPIIKCDKSKTTLAVEITCRAGPAVTFKVYRTRHAETLLRAIELQPNEQYVKVLDISKCVNRNTGKVNKPLVYFSVRLDEFLDTYNYCMALDPKSVTLANIHSFIH